jgi:hypothetical protein
MAEFNPKPWVVARSVLSKADRQSHLMAGGEPHPGLGVAAGLTTVVDLLITGVVKKDVLHPSLEDQALMHSASIYKLTMTDLQTAVDFGMEAETEDFERFRRRATVVYNGAKIGIKSERDFRRWALLSNQLSEDLVGHELPPIDVWPHLAVTMGNVAHNLYQARPLAGPVGATALRAMARMYNNPHHVRRYPRAEIAGDLVGLSNALVESRPFLAKTVGAIELDRYDKGNALWAAHHFLNQGTALATEAGKERMARTLRIVNNYSLITARFGDRSFITPSASSGDTAEY